MRDIPTPSNEELGENLSADGVVKHCNFDFGDGDESVRGHG